VRVGAPTFARRPGLSEPRYGYYVTGEREANLATLVRICEVLAATPNDLLLPEGKPPAQWGRDRLPCADYRGGGQLNARPA
jgi:hypothetical protein